jgi:serine/threonine protein kinase
LIEELGKGGESIIYRLLPYLPIEIVAKMPLTEDFKDLLMEDHLLKMISHKDYVCNVMEEIIEYNKEKSKIVGLISIVECAKNDLTKITDIWLNEEKAKVKIEHFSLHKLAYFGLKAMEAMCYLHRKNVYFGDMKPDNLLVFRDYKVKLGDLGISIKLPDDCPDSY